MASHQVDPQSLILSHGSAAVESGFSINNDMLVENLLEESLVGQRIVYDSYCRVNVSLSRLEICVTIY